MIQAENKLWAFMDPAIRLGMAFLNQLNNCRLLKTDSLLLSAAHKSLLKRTRCVIAKLEKLKFRALLCPPVCKKRYSARTHIDRCTDLHVYAVV
jgi:hypothetical protein